MNPHDHSRADRAVPILLYHSIAAAGRSCENHWQVGVADFRIDMGNVRMSGRTPMTARGYAEWLRAGADPSVRPVLVTFDDGFADYADVALPVLAEFGLCATLFVTSGYLDEPGMLSASAVTDLTAEGTEIGAHSVTHPHLDTIPLAAARTEIVDSGRVLADITGTPVTSFAYPHGSFRSGVRAAVAGAGYQSAHAVKNALSHDTDDPFALSRFTVTAATPRSRVRLVLAGEGAPLGWRRERVRTTGYRVVRWVRTRRAPRGVGTR